MIYFILLLFFSFFFFSFFTLVLYKNLLSYHSHDHTFFAFSDQQTCKPTRHFLRGIALYKKLLLLLLILLLYLLRFQTNKPASSLGLECPLNQMSMGVQNPTGCRASVDVVSAFSSGIRTRRHDPEFAHTLDYIMAWKERSVWRQKKKKIFLILFFKALDDLPKNGREIEGASSLNQTNNQNSLKGMGKTSERLTEWSAERLWVFPSGQSPS